MSDKMLAELIRQRLGECSPAERKVARAVLADYPSAGLDTVARLADRAGVSGPTVVRLATRLGFTGFPDLQRALREEMGAAPRPADSEGSPLAHRMSIISRRLQDSLAQIPAFDIEGAIALFADQRHRILLVGDFPANYLYDRLGEVRTGVYNLGTPSSLMPDELAAVGKRDTLVVFDFPPYHPSSAQIAWKAGRRGAKVVLFTDPHLSPAAANADLVLPCDASTGSLTHLIALVDALIGEAFGRPTQPQRNKNPLATHGSISTPELEELQRLHEQTTPKYSDAELDRGFTELVESVFGGYMAPTERPENDIDSSDDADRPGHP